MARTVGIGQQDFGTVRENGYFYVDKTAFIQEWWESGDSVTLITRPRRFGKTLNMSMVETFFSVKAAGCGYLFDGLSIWKQKRYQNLQGSYPVLFLTFADVKESSYEQARKKICQLLATLYEEYRFLTEGDFLSAQEKAFFASVTSSMEDFTASLAVKMLAGFLFRYYGKKVIILLDEYDTPMQEAYVNGFWDELADFMRGIFNAAFKANPYLERAILTGITRISRESIFSDLNNLEVVTTTSDKYATSFGFTEQEVFAALEEFGLSGEREKVKYWYDGFVFGACRDIYNPWSIINYLSKRKFAPYWANTSSNSLAGKLIREGSPEIKTDFEALLGGGTLEKSLDEQIVFQQLSEDEQAIWSLLLAGGYLRADAYSMDDWTGRACYRLMLTNAEVRFLFRDMVQGWFARDRSGYNAFLQALLRDDLKAMNAYMNRVALTTFSSFDSGKQPSDRTEPERFYHGFVLGLIVELSGKYHIRSNRESGFGRYDVVMEPKNRADDAIIMEFKVHDKDSEKTMEETVQSALLQIAEKEYDTDLTARGIPKERIRHYGFAFRGKEVLIGRAG